MSASQQLFVSNRDGDIKRDDGIIGGVGPLPYIRQSYLQYTYSKELSVLLARRDTIGTCVGELFNYLCAKNKNMIK